jgi:hypothetical protein
MEENAVKRKAGCKIATRLDEGFRKLPQPERALRRERGIVMTYIMTLAIESASTFSIAVVDNPVALKRGGGIPDALLRLEP